MSTKLRIAGKRAAGILTGQDVEISLGDDAVSVPMGNVHKLVITVFPEQVVTATLVLVGVEIDLENVVLLPSNGPHPVGLADFDPHWKDAPEALGARVTPLSKERVAAALGELNDPNVKRRLEIAEFEFRWVSRNTLQGYQGWLRVNLKGADICSTDATEAIAAYREGRELPNGWTFEPFAAVS